MLKKAQRRVTRLTTKIIRGVIRKKGKKTQQLQPRPPSPSPPPPPPPPPPPTGSSMASPSTAPFLFPQTQSSVVPDPSTFFSPHLLTSPLPTNCFFQNFVLKNGDQPEYIHPYLIKSANSSLNLCYPSRFFTPAFIYQTFVPDLAVSSGDGSGSSQTHVVSSFDDLSVTLDLPPALRFFLVRGSPFVTCSTLCPTQISISSVHAFTSNAFTSNASYTKHKFQLSNGQTYLCYSSAPLRLAQSTATLLVSSNSGFSGTIRVAVLVDPTHESVLDRFCTCYPVSGDADIGKPFSLEYRWEKKGWGDLLLLAHPLHLRLLQRRCNGGGVTVLDNFKYSSIDGDLVGVAGDSWVLKTDPISITWHSIGGVREEGHGEIISTLVKDVDGLNATPITTPSSYFYGKAVARAARFAVIAEEVGFAEVIPKVRSFLKSSITPWLDGTFHANGFLHESKWGGIVTKQGSTDSGADFGFGIYNDHHYHLGYFLYAAAVLSKIDHAWGRKYKPQVYSMVADIMTLSRKSHSSYARLRCFDLWKLHSWAGGLTEFADGRNQESTSEAVNAYYSAGLLGLSYGDTHLLSTASTITSLEMLSAETWWHVKPSLAAAGEGGIMYEEDFGRENRLVGVLWANKRDSGLWFAPPDWRECRFGIQVLPLLPVSEVLFRDVGFLKAAVKWAESALGRDGVGEGWKGFVYAMEGVYDREVALEKTRELKGFDDGNSASNLLWWLHSRRGGGGGRAEQEDDGDDWWRSKSWFSHYCH